MRKRYRFADPRCAPRRLDPRRRPGFGGQCRQLQLVGEHSGAHRSRRGRRQQQPRLRHHTLPTQGRTRRRSRSASAARPNQVRVEMYPGTVCGTYDGWSNVGGVHLEANLGGGNLGAITMPVDGQGGAFALRGGILSSTPIGTGRVDRRHVPDSDRLSGPARSAPVERPGCRVRSIRVHGEPRGGLERWRRVGGPLSAVRHRHGNGPQDHRQCRHRSELDPDDRPRRHLFRLRQLRLQRRRARYHGRVVPSDDADSDPRHPQATRVLGAGAVGRRTRVVTGSDHPTVRDRQPRPAGDRS